MPYDPQVVKAAREQLEERRAAAIGNAAALRERLCAEIPRLGEIERELAAALPEITHIILDHGSPEAIERIRQHNLALQEERTALLHRAGYAVDGFEPQYTCPHCEDTGYVDGRVCDCYRTLLRQEACRRLSEMSSLKLTDFDSLNLGYYDTAVDPKLGISLRENMQNNIDCCRRYADSFSPTSRSLLLFGPTGLGKTHLALAVAKTVTEHGFSVIYSSTQPLLRRMTDETFGREEGGCEEQLSSCDLLVLDDLGMEYINDASRACLYTVLNNRLLQGRPTVISTNLSILQIKDRYGEQISSRIIGNYITLRFAGMDVRQQIRRQTR